SRRERLRSASLQRLPTDVPLTLGSLNGGAATDSKEALCEEQVENNREVDHERSQLEPGNVLRKLVHLEGQKQRRRDQGQVLSPAPLIPEPDRFSAFEHRVEGERQPDQLQGPRIEREQAVELVKEPGATRLHRPA